ncbi:exonuclease [Vibrio phage EniLVp02]
MDLNNWAKNKPKVEEPVKKHPTGNPFAAGNARRPKPDKDGVILVDFSQIVLSTVMATFKPTEELSVDLLRHLILNTLRSQVLRHRKKYPFPILCVDNATGGYWRKKVAWYYKASRKKKRDEAGWDFDTIFAAMEAVKTEIVEYLPYAVMDIEGLEADDHIGVLAPAFARAGIPVLIVSSDGDFTQLHEKNISQYSPQAKKVVKPKYGSPMSDLLEKCFRGDRKDGIANIKSPADLYAQPGSPRATQIKQVEIDRWKAAAITDENLQGVLTEEQFNRYRENRNLLDFLCIPQDIRDKITKKYSEIDIPPARKVIDYFGRYKLNQLMKHIDDYR